MEDNRGLRLENARLKKEIEGHKDWHKIVNQLPPIQMLDIQGEAKNQIKRLKKSMEREFEREREAMKEKYRKKKMEILQEFSPNSDRNSSFCSVPR